MQVGLGEMQENHNRDLYILSLLTQNIKLLSRRKKNYRRFPSAVLSVCGWFSLPTTAFPSLGPLQYSYFTPETETRQCLTLYEWRG